MGSYFPSNPSGALLKRKFHPHVREHVYARVLSVLHYVSSDLQRGTEGIFSPLRLELSVKCLSSLIISIRVTGDRAFCSERTYCKNCQIEFVSRSTFLSIRGHNYRHLMTCGAAHFSQLKKKESENRWFGLLQSFGLNLNGI